MWYLWQAHWTPHSLVTVRIKLASSQKGLADNVDPGAPVTHSVQPQQMLNCCGPHTTWLLLQEGATAQLVQSPELLEIGLGQWVSYDRMASVASLTSIRLWVATAAGVVILKQGVGAGLEAACGPGL